ncbi:MAG: hypothetical protein R2848_06695 [Thermomicrobiales bacterium]
MTFARSTPQQLKTLRVTIDQSLRHAQIDRERIGSSAADKYPAKPLAPLPTGFATVIPTAAQFFLCTRPYRSPILEAHDSITRNEGFTVRRES